LFEKLFSVIYIRSMLHYYNIPTIVIWFVCSFAISYLLLMKPGMSLCNIICKTVRLFLWDRESQHSCSWTAILSDPRGTLTGRDYRRVSLISKARGWSSLDRWSARLDCPITLNRNFGLCCFVVSKCRNANDEFTFFLPVLNVPWWSIDLIDDDFDRSIHPFAMDPRSWPSRPCRSRLG